MSKKSVSVMLTAEEVEGLQSALQIVTSGKPQQLKDDQLEAFVGLAVRSWIDLVTGRRRYRSLTEQYLDWLSQLYSSILQDEEPSEARLFTQLNFPYGQSQYLARVLRDQHPGPWRVKALAAVRKALLLRKVDASQWVKEGRGEDMISMNISKAGRVELGLLLGRLSERNVQGVSPIQTKGTMGSSVAVLLPASNVELLLSELDKIPGVQQ
jgi:hypothetical protein